VPLDKSEVTCPLAPRTESDATRITCLHSFPARQRAEMRLAGVAAADDGCKFFQPRQTAFYVIRSK
jgi:hypothetical protein